MKVLDQFVQNLRIEVKALYNANKRENRFNLLKSAFSDITKNDEPEFSLKA